VWISTYQPSVGPAGANTVPTGRGGALIKADPATANSVYTSYPAGDYSSPVIHTVSIPAMLGGISCSQVKGTTFNRYSKLVQRVHCQPYSHGRLPQASRCPYASMNPAGCPSSCRSAPEALVWHAAPLALLNVSMMIAKHARNTCRWPYVRPGMSFAVTAGDGNRPDNRQYVLLQGRRPNQG